MNSPSSSRLGCAALCAAFVLPLAACGGSSHAMPPTTGSLSSNDAAFRSLSDKKTPDANVAEKLSKVKTGVVGVKADLLSGWAAQQLAAEASRKEGKLKKSFAIGGVGSAPAAGTARTLKSTLGGASTLVLYDTDGAWGYLGELYAMSAANLAGHFGSTTTEPIGAYTAGQMNAFTGTIYIGSSYHDSSNDPAPAAFYNDMMNSTHPILWMGDNIWNAANAVTPSAFQARYGWDPTNSYFAPNGVVGNITQVNYKGAALTRTFPAETDGGVVHPYGMTSAVTDLADAVDTSTSPATTFPWAIRSQNLTYVGEIPFDYVNETDRVIAVEDLMFDLLAPATASRHRAMVRLEDVNVNDDMTQVKAVVDYLYSQGVPFGFNIIPHYLDPFGHYTNGVPQDTPLSAATALVSTIKYMLAHGGTPIAEGFTHQNQRLNDPYDAVSGDDAEFFMAHVDPNNYVVWDGPVAGDSSTWATGRVTSSVNEFKNAGLPIPALWVTPHYMATDVDYHAIASTFPTRYERSIYFNGVLTGGATNYSHYIGEFFPYEVMDVYGTKVIPENLGDYEPSSLNHNAVRTAADIVHEAQLNLAVRDGYASFFYDPSNGVSAIQQIIPGIKGLGYAFIAPAP